MMLGRRSFLAGAACAAALAPHAAMAAPKIAIVDWALLETALALGIVPAAAVELMLYRQVVIEPAVPGEVLDLGLRGSVNFELLAAVAPDVIYGSNYSAWAHPQMERIAPVRSLPIYVSGEQPFAKAQAAMRKMAADFALEREAEDYISATDAELAKRGERLAQHRSRPLLIINIGDPRHFRAFGGDSMFGDVATKMGFENAWGIKTSYSATAPVGLEVLADYPEAIVIMISPIPPDAKRVMPQSALWQVMPAVREGRSFVLEPINPFGGLPAARRFARLLEEALRAAA
ncbi:ABC transporter substrate-binding protein [Limoniibacter endophyticus]|uniref:Amino acid ABC transporter substrate-binding protein n=1 Tax=Limoniibacter endophyticus TaxID=1565040 RepID=A0A8J3DQB6_9HYPH|nr:ABC transporter substrate-binding protein [Limoniibacter endophyticus]GHC73631.1 amino acid ABC transporter substrate-binding protein [Limoniibacter endophyticus]